VGSPNIFCLGKKKGKRNSSRGGNGNWGGATDRHRKFFDLKGKKGRRSDTEGGRPPANKSREGSYGASPKKYILLEECPQGRKKMADRKERTSRSFPTLGKKGSHFHGREGKNEGVHHGGKRVDRL